jgi:hypothetical protein
MHQEQQRAIQSGLIQSYLVQWIVYQLIYLAACGALIQPIGFPLEGVRRSFGCCYMNM